MGGEDHRVGQRQHPEDSYIALEKWGRDRLGIQSDVLFRWSGQIIEPLDGLAYIGLNPGDKENVYIVSGDSGHGLTHGTIAGMVLSDLIRGVENRYAGIYDPARFNWKRIGQFTRENYKGAIQYADWFMADEMRSPDELLAGEGAIFSDGVHKIAIYKDENGHLHEFSAACPHLKGVIRWNSAEKTWDCPFHGSRFSKYGEVLNGPSMSNLQPRRERAANFSKGLIAAVVDSKMGLDDRSS